jgi:hypothetical protein
MLTNALAYFVVAASATSSLIYLEVRNTLAYFFFYLANVIFVDTLNQGKKEKQSSFTIVIVLTSALAYFVVAASATSSLEGRNTLAYFTIVISTSFIF